MTSFFIAERSIELASREEINNDVIMRSTSLVYPARPLHPSMMVKFER